MSTATARERVVNGVNADELFQTMATIEKDPDVS